MSDEELQKLSGTTTIGHMISLRKYGYAISGLGDPVSFPASFWRVRFKVSPDLKTVDTLFLAWSYREGNTDKAEIEEFARETIARQYFIDTQIEIVSIRRMDTGSKIGVSIQQGEKPQFKAKNKVLKDILANWAISG